MVHKAVQKARVALGDRSYDVLVGEGLLASLGEYIKPVVNTGRVIIITDENVEKAGYLSACQRALEQAGFAHDEIVIPPGEESKSFRRLEDVLEALLTLRPDRRTALIALGGGVVGDLTGFAASILLRGVPFIQAPTTLLAMVDSSVGGKTGINSEFGKNLIGSFYQPRIVIADTSTLHTLPQRELNAGYAEVVKYGLIDQPDFFQLLEDHEFDVVKSVVACCKAKARIVSEDETEQGKRALLNLGHTFGHALEAETGYSSELLHGEAVAIGMVMAFQFSEQLGVCHRGDVVRIKAHLSDVGLPVSPLDIRETWDINRLISHMKQDKKAKDGQLTFILVRGIGQAFVEEKIGENKLRHFLECVMNNSLDT